ncbi:MAG TPA: M23 family metallopeptidase [Burkholderiaceae bacterium]|nr:M23 family metallopeptidase [Burkholderiaceae bacterium]
MSRTRHIAPLVVLAAVSVIVATAVAATTRSRPATAAAEAYARADAGGSTYDSVSVSGNGDRSGAQTRVTASTRNGNGRATAFAAVEKVNVFDGLVTADEVRVRAEASDGGTSTSGAVIGLAVEGAPRPAPGGRTVYSLNGYGDMVALGSGSSGILGLRVHLSKDYKSYKAGSVVSIGYASAKASDAVKATAPKAAPAKPAKERPAKKKAAKKKAAKKKHREAKQSAREKLENSLTAQQRAWRSELMGLKGYAFPVAGKHSFSDTFGAYRSDVPAHVGADVFASFGTPIVAVADGRIYRVGTLKISGNRLWLRDRNGFRYFYAHLSDFAAAAYNGADVHAGEVIGFVGNTGDAEPTPPHLHFEVHMPDGAVVNPTPFLGKWDAGGVSSEKWLKRYGKDPGVRPGALVVVKDFLAEG